MELTKFGGVLGIIGITPVFADNQDFMRARPLVLRPYAPPKNVFKEDTDLRAFKTSSIMRNWAVANEIEFIDLKDLYCNESRCTRWTDKGWLYQDSNHLPVLGGASAVLLRSDWLLSMQMD